MKKIIKLTESDLNRIIKRVINEEKKPINSISDVEEFYRGDSSLIEYIDDTFKRVLKNMDHNSTFFKSEEHHIDQLSHYVAFSLLDFHSLDGYISFKQKDEKYRKDVKDFLVGYIKDKYKTKFKKLRNNK